MQSAIVTYPDGHTELHPTPLPMPFGISLETAFRDVSMLYIHNEETGFKYGWDANGNVKMFDMNKGRMYEWIPPPTMHEAVYSQSAGMAFIFKTDGTIIHRNRPYPYTSPTRVWEYVWPSTPETVLVEGNVAPYWDEWDDYVTDYGDKESECSKCSSGPKMPGYCEHFYEKDDTRHKHPCYINGAREEYWCYHDDCVPCPGCRGPYDGADHGGLGCSRDCAYGDFMDHERYDRW